MFNEMECLWHSSDKRPKIPSGYHFCPYCRRHRFLYFKPYELIFILFLLLFSGLVVTAATLKSDKTNFQEQRVLFADTPSHTPIITTSFTPIPSYTPSRVMPTYTTTIPAKSTYTPTSTNTVTLTYTQTQIPTNTPTITASPQPQKISLNQPVRITTNGADDPKSGDGENIEDVTDGSLEYIRASTSRADGCIGFANNTYNEEMIINVTIYLEQEYRITRIRYNQGSVERASTWHADSISSPFGLVNVHGGTDYINGTNVGRGTWTEQTGSLIASEITIVLKKTRISDTTDWLFIGEIEIYGVLN